MDERNFTLTLNLGLGEVLDAETLGLYLDIDIFAKLMFRDSYSLPLGSLHSRCKELMTRFNSVSLIRIFRECNMVADSMAKKVLSMTLV